MVTIESNETFEEFMKKTNKKTHYNIVNCTSERVSLYTKTGEIITLPAAKLPASIKKECTIENTEVAMINNIPILKRLQTKSNTGYNFIPKEKENTFYIVPLTVAHKYSDRNDFLVVCENKWVKTTNVFGETVLHFVCTSLVHI